MKIFNQSDDEELIDFFDNYISFEANIFSIHHNYHVSIINKFVDDYGYNGIAKESSAPNIYFRAIKKESPDVDDFEIHKLLYEKFFLLKDGDWLESMKSKQVSFYFRKFKRNNKRR